LPIQQNQDLTLFFIPTPTESQERGSQAIHILSSEELERAHQRSEVPMDVLQGINEEENEMNEDGADSDSQKANETHESDDVDEPWAPLSQPAAPAHHSQAPPFSSSDKILTHNQKKKLKRKLKRQQNQQHHHQQNQNQHQHLTESAAKRRKFNEPPSQPSPH